MPTILTGVRVKPYGNQVLVELDDKSERRSKGGIVLPDNAKNALEPGTVKEVGPGLPHVETGIRIVLDVKKNERVLVPRHNGTEITLNGKNMKLLNASEISAWLEAESNEPFAGVA